MLEKFECLSNKNHIITGLYELRPKVFIDERGFFFEAYNQKEFASLNLNMTFVQDNISFSKKNVLRGMHFQKNHSQGKLIQCISGMIFDVVIDIRPDSLTYGEFATVILDSVLHNQFYIPEGFAHGFYVMTDKAEISYKCTDFYYPEDEDGILWDDPFFNIPWPIPKNEKPVLLEKDLNYKPFKGAE